jgi:hypothetical protein
MNYPMPAFPFCPPQGSLLSSKKARVAIIPPNGIPETARKTVTLPVVIESRGISDMQESAMLAGSMFGLSQF